MTRTKRIYNNPNLKKTVRNDITKPQAPLFKDMTESEMAAWVNDSLRNSIQFHGFLYHPYKSGLCMGRCPHCRNPDEDQKHIRKIRKREFRKVIDEEISCVESSETALFKELDAE